MARDIRDEIEGLFKAAQDDPSLGDKPNKKRPPASTKDLPTNPGMMVGSETPKKKMSTNPPASANTPAGKPKPQPTMPPPASAPQKKAAPTMPPEPNVLSIQTLPPGKKSAAMLTPDLLKNSVPGASGGTGSITSPGSTSPGARAFGSVPSQVARPATKGTPTRPPMASSKSSPAAAPAGGKRKKNLQMIEYGPDEPLVDHKGRAKPMYKPRTPRPRSWHPSKVIRLLLGLFPGTRLMALDSAAAGWPYMALGVLALVPAIVLALNFSRSSELIGRLMIDGRWLVAHGATIVVLLCVFEILRLGSFFEERNTRRRIPRVLAALALPSVVVVLGAPELMAVWPRFVESAWFAALVLSMGGLAGSVWCAFEGTTAKARAIAGIAAAAVLIGAIVAGIATGALNADTFSQLAAAGRAAGFHTLPELLGY